MHHDSETARLAEAERKRHRNSVKSPEAYQQSRLYATAAWQRMRLSVLNHEPLCRACASDGRVEAATVVDHIRRHNNDINLFYDRTNLQPLCVPCHNFKTAGEDHAQKLLDRAG
jgi:5-methylcytosine-specific restriction endonuclease McrA